MERSFVNIQRNLQMYPFNKPLEDVKIPTEIYEEKTKIVMNPSLMDGIILNYHLKKNTLENISIATIPKKESLVGESYIFEKKDTVASMPYWEFIEAYINQKDKLIIKGFRYINDTKTLYQIEDVHGIKSDLFYFAVIHLLLSNILENEEIKNLTSYLNIFFDSLDTINENSSYEEKETSLGSSYLITKTFNSILEKIYNHYLKDVIEISDFNKYVDYKLVYGEEFLHLKKLRIKEEKENINLCNLPLQRAYSKLTKAEKLLIPKIPENHIVSKEEIFITKQIDGSFNSNCEDALKIHNVLIEGEAGSGKSQLVRVLAAKLQRPYMSFSCSASTEESDLKGMLLPAIDEETEAFDNLDEETKEIYKIILNSPENELNEKIGAYLNLPSLFEIELEPTKAYKKLNVFLDLKDISSVDSFTVMSLYNTIVNQKIKMVVKKVSNQTNNGNVRYKYIESPIIKAIKNGYILEMQEVAMVKNQSVFSCLFDVLERNSIGIIQTHVGEVNRHPDFFCFATTNSKYIGCKPLNQAFKSRFQLTVKMDSPNKEEIMERIKSKVDLMDEEALNNIATAFITLKAKIKELYLQGDITMRAIFQFAEGYKRCVEQEEIDELIWNCLIYPISTDDEESQELYDSLAACTIFKPLN